MISLAARIFVLILSFVATVAYAAPDANRCGEFQKTVGESSAPRRFRQFLDIHWKYLMTEYPEWATYEGYPGQDDRLSDRSLKALERRRQETKCIFSILKKIPRRALSGEDGITYDLLAHDFETAIEGFQFGDDYMPVSQLGNPATDFSELLSSSPADKLKDYENILKRFEAFPLYITQIIEVMREGMKRKYMPVKAFMPKIDAQIAKYIDNDPTKTVFYETFKDMPNLSKEDQEKIRARAKDILVTKVIPAVRSFRKFFNEEYAPLGRENIAMSSLPGGAAWYAYSVKRFTTTNRTPEELHELGLKEVARLSNEMSKIRQQLKFDGDVKAFNKFLLTDKRFQYTNGDDLIAGYREIAKRIDAGLPKIFKTLPRLTYGVKAMPTHTGASGPAAYYVQGSPEAGRPGYFMANINDLPSRPKWAMESLTMHEAVPGHHLQIALAQELKGLPEQRKHSGYTAFTEGWGLYAEGLGDEIGMFKDPYQKYGNLYWEMLRAVRLVVDTGMHFKGWSKQKALDYYRAEMPAPDVDSENEINRYITWPGQALAYKVGQLKFRELREYSKNQLGEAFDVREFHDEVLRHGALPLDVLEKNVRTWVAQKKVKARHT
jgi:uncharacterized protein (DUF885 family)